MNDKRFALVFVGIKTKKEVTIAISPNETFIKALAAEIISLQKEGGFTLESLTLEPIDKETIQHESN